METEVSDTEVSDIEVSDTEVSETDALDLNMLEYDDWDMMVPANVNTILDWIGNDGNKKRYALCYGNDLVVYFDSEEKGKKYMKHIAAMIIKSCLLYTSPSPRDLSTSRMPSSA